MPSIRNAKTYGGCRRHANRLAFQRNLYRSRASMVVNFCTIGSASERAARTLGGTSQIRTIFRQEPRPADSHRV